MRLAHQIFGYGEMFSYHHNRSLILLLCFLRGDWSKQVDGIIKTCCMQVMKLLWVSRPLLTQGTQPWHLPILVRGQRIMEPTIAYEPTISSRRIRCFYQLSYRGPYKVPFHKLWAVIISCFVMHTRSFLPNITINKFSWCSTLSLPQLFHTWTSKSNAVFDSV